MIQNRRLYFALNVALFVFAPACAGSFFTPGNLVVSVEGNGVQGAIAGPYTDNQASPLTLFQYSVLGVSSASYVNSLVLPQTSSGANFAISGEYGSSSEGTLQLSGNGQYLTIGAYGVNASAFNQNPGSYSPNAANIALGQSGSMLGQGYNAVARVGVLIDQNGNVDSSTGVYNIFNANNPRSVYSANGTSLYLSGQGTSGDNTGGVFYATRGSSTATSITGNDAGGSASQDTRTVQIYNGQLYVSADSKSGPTNRDYVATLGAAGNPPTTLANGGNGPTMLPGFGNSGGTGRVTVTATNTNGFTAVGSTVNLSPENYFFANPTTLYVADSGIPKNNSGSSTLGDGGLQKWVYNSGTGMWVLQYTLYSGLNLVPNTQSDAAGQPSYTTGLYGLAGVVVGGQVYLYATNFTIGDTDPTFLYGIADTLNATSGAGESFVQLAAAPVDSNFKGVSFAPTSVPEPASLWLFGLGAAAIIAVRRHHNQ